MGRVGCVWAGGVCLGRESVFWRVFALGGCIWAGGGCVLAGEGAFERVCLGRGGCVWARGGCVLAGEGAFERVCLGGGGGAFGQGEGAFGQARVRFDTLQLPSLPVTRRPICLLLRPRPSRCTQPEVCTSWLRE